MSEHHKTNWKEVITFYVIACSISWPLFAWRDLYPESWYHANLPNELKNLATMWGPGISAIICFFVFRKTHIRTISLTGTSIGRSLLFYFMPFVVWIILSITNPVENSLLPIFFLKLISFGFLMILGEELGWRGFLQDSLQHLKDWKKWLILGLMWEFWHFTRGLTSGEMPQIIVRKSIFIVAVLILTFIIGRLTDKTKSLMVAITLHSWINIQFEFAHINAHIAGGISLVIWALLIWKWEHQQVQED